MENIHFVSNAETLEKNVKTLKKKSDFWNELITENFKEGGSMREIEFRGKRIEVETGGI